MTDAPTALTRLVGDPDRFLADDFGRRPVHRTGTDAAGFDDLLTLDDVDHVVAGSGLRAPAFRLVRDGATLPRSAVTRSARIGARPVDDLVDVRAVHRAFADGASIVLQGLQRSWPPVAALCRSLEVELTHPAQANAYLTPPVAQGLDLHADAHDVFAVQTHGVKRWVVHPPSGEVWDLELHAGDVLYLPAGTRHAAQTVDEPSLHLTIGVRTVDRRAVLRRVVEQLLDEDAFDGALPGGWADDPQRCADRLRADLAALSDRVAGADPATALDAAADGFWAARVPALTGGLRDLLALDRVDDDTSLRRRVDATCRVSVHGELLHLQLGDRLLQLPVAAEDVVRELCARDRLRPRDLAHLADASSRLVLCRRLVREGLLTIDRDGA